MLGSAMDRLRALLGVTSRDTELLLGSSDGDDASQGGADRTRSASPSAEETHWVVKSLPGDLDAAWHMSLAEQHDRAMPCAAHTACPAHARPPPRATAPAAVALRMCHARRACGPPGAPQTPHARRNLPSGDLRRAEPRRSAPPLPPTYSIRGRERKPSAKAAAAVAAAVGPGLTAAAATVPAAAAPKGKGKGAPAKAPAAAAPPAAPARPVVITHVPAQGASPLKRRAAGGVEGVAPSPIKYRGPNVGFR